MREEPAGGPVPWCMMQWLTRLRAAPIENLLLPGGRVPVVPLLVLLPSWISTILLDRPPRGDESLFFFYVTDLADPFTLLPGLAVGPLLNTALSQVLLVSGLVLFFGIPLERRLGAGRTLAIFWTASIAGSIGGAAMIHAAQALAPDATIVERAWDRAYGGGSAGGFGLMGAYAAGARSSMPWIALFAAWEVMAWYSVLQNLTPAFHVVAFAAGMVAGRVMLAGRLEARPTEPL